MHIRFHTRLPSVGLRFYVAGLPSPADHAVCACFSTTAERDAFTEVKAVSDVLVCVCSVSSIVLRGATEGMLDDVERAVDDGVNAYKVQIHLWLVGLSSSVLGKLPVAWGLAVHEITHAAFGSSLLCGCVFWVCVWV